MMGRCGCDNPRCNLAPDDGRHGSANGYRNQYCRCPACGTAHTVKCAQEKADRIARGAPDYVHGTVNGYANYGCRIPGCCQPHKRSSSQPTTRRKVTQK